MIIIEIDLVIVYGLRKIKVERGNGGGERGEVRECEREGGGHILYLIRQSLYYRYCRVSRTIQTLYINYCVHIVIIV